MYKSFKIRNFRCFKELDFDDFAQINLIAGVNNVGKTAFLEAVFLHSAGYNPELILKINAYHGIETVSLSLGPWTEQPLSSLFNQFDVSKTIELGGDDVVAGRRLLRIKAVTEPSEPSEIEGPSRDTSGESKIRYTLDESKPVLSSSEVAKVLELEHEEDGKRKTYRMVVDRKGIRVEPIPPSPPFQAFLLGDHTRVPVTELSRLYGNLEIRNRHGAVLNLLKIIEPRLNRLAVVAVAGEVMLHGDIGMERLVPLPLMGGGTVRMASLVLFINNAPNGVVLVDEVENGLHHSAMFNVWRAIASEARRSKTQIFATTHSWECIKAAHQAFTLDGKYDFRLHRLGWDNGQIKAVTYYQETLDAAIKAGLEVR